MALWAEDSLGKRYNVSKRSVKKLIKEAATIVKTA
jgi:hypothetical protein